ncbi:hypothetical protein FRC10_011701 [Ceratobasidium sp. 414]|nr:hypothetical protein FRC10_011701 [Ceratobasidium sp. 414]
MSSPLIHESSGTAEKMLDPKAWFKADYYKPFFFGTEGSKVNFLDFTHGPPNTEDSTVVECTETISLRVTPHPDQRGLYVLDFVNAKNHKEQIGKPGLKIKQRLGSGRRLALKPVWARSSNDRVQPHMVFDGEVSPGSEFWPDNEFCPDNEFWPDTDDESSTDGVSPEWYYLQPLGLYEVYLNGERIRKLVFENKPASSV